VTNAMQKAQGFRDFGPCSLDSIDSGPMLKLRIWWVTNGGASSFPHGGEEAEKIGRGQE
jgi:hypothetical protein